MDTNSPAPISSYRLGDLCLVTLSEPEKQELINDFPDSIGADYIRGGCRSDIDAIICIVMKHIQKYAALIPPDITDCTVVHLRLGDVVAGNEYHEKQKRPIYAGFLKEMVPQDSGKIYVIGKCFFAKTSSTNYAACIQLSKRYIENVLRELGDGTEHFDGGFADVDLCAAVQAKWFIQGRGFFSKLIVDIRKRLHRPCIETSVHD